MTDDIIGMDDMMAVYEITDQFGIDRETISVPLEKEGDGAVSRQPDGALEIVVPATSTTREWLPALKAIPWAPRWQESLRLRQARQ